MTIRINHNVSAMRSARHLGETEKKLAASLEKLSSGFAINRGADSPAGLMISEQMRARVGSVNQAIANTELATTMVQTTEGSLGEINNLLVRMRQLALHAANEGVNDSQAMEADQLEITNSLESIKRISETASFGQKKLLDGSTGTSGVAQGAGLDFVTASHLSKTSPVQGYEVVVEKTPARAYLTGESEITPDMVEGLAITLAEGGRTIQVTGRANESPENFVSRLRNEVNAMDMNLEISLTNNGSLGVRHTHYGSEAAFTASSSIAGVLSDQGGVPQSAIPGQDIRGTIGGEAAKGRGQYLTGVKGNENTEGITLRYTGPLAPTGELDQEGRPVMEPRPQAGVVGSVNTINNSVKFQTGPNAGEKTSIMLPNVAPSNLGRMQDNPSGFKSLSDINVNTSQGAKDTLGVLDQAINDISLVRGGLGAFQRNNLEVNLSAMRITAENLVAAESAIRDTDVASEVAEFTKNRIQLEAGTAMTAQANQIPARVITLLE